MKREEFYEYLEEADDRELREILDAAVNRFHELHWDHELLLISLPRAEGRRETLERVMAMLQKEI